MKSIISVFLLLLISGCAPLDVTPSTTGIKPTDHPRDMQVKEITSTCPDSALYGSRVWHQLKLLNFLPVWENGIASSINEANIVSKNSIKTVIIKATLLNFELPSKGESLIEANYQLIDANTGKAIIDFDIKSTGSMKDPWSHPTTDWTEQAVKQALSSNIEKLIEKLNEIDENILPIKR